MRTILLWLAVTLMPSALGLAQENPGGDPDPSPPPESVVESPQSPPSEPEATEGDESTDPEPATSRIVAVTVYPDEALVTREVQVPPGEGVVEVVVSPLPEEIRAPSLYTEGTDALRVLSTRFRDRVVREDVRAEVRMLDEQLKALRDQVRASEAEAEVARKDLEFVGKLEGFTASRLEGTVAKGTLEEQPFIGLAKYVMESRAETSAALVEREMRAAELAEELKLAEARRARLSRGNEQSAFDALILVERTDGEGGVVRLNYAVLQAGWEPRYRLRAGGESDPIRLEYLGEITQISGESWDDVHVTLSTAQPALDATPPDLVALRIADPGVPGFGMMGGGMGGMGGGGVVAVPAPGGDREALVRQLGDEAKAMRGRAEHGFEIEREEGGQALLNQAAALEQAKDLLAEAPQDGQGALDADALLVTFKLDRPLSIPSRYDSIYVDVAHADLTPEFFDRAVPVLTPRVYRLARLRNEGPFVLLPGEAAMYVGDDFVGRMDLPLVASGERFTVGFGADPQVQVDRRLRSKTNGVQGGNQVHGYRFRIAVRSFRAKPIRVEIWDRLPLPSGENVAVTLVESTPETSAEDNYVRNVRPENLLRWDLTVPPDGPETEPTTIVYEFKLEYARGLSLDQISAGLRVDAISGGAETGGFGGGMRSLVPRGKR